MKILLSTIISAFIVGSFGFVFAQESPMSIEIIDTSAFNTFFVNIADSLPRIIGAAIIMIVGIFVGRFIGKIIETKTGTILQRNLEHFPSNYSDEMNKSERIKPSKAIGGTVKWFVYIFFIIAAANVLEFKELAEPLAAIWLWFPNILAAMFVLMIGIIMANYISKWVETEFPENKSANYIKTGSKVLIFGIVVAIALTQIGIGTTIFPIVIAALSIGAAIAIGISLRNIIPALLSSSHRTYLKEGQKIKIGDIEGSVISVDLMSVLLMNKNNEKMVIPVNTLNEKTIIILED